MTQRMLIWESWKELKRDWLCVELICLISKASKKPSTAAMAFFTPLLLLLMIQWVFSFCRCFISIAFVYNLIMSRQRVIESKVKDTHLHQTSSPRMCLPKKGWHGLVVGPVTIVVSPSISMMCTVGEIAFCLFLIGKGWCFSTHSLITRKVKNKIIWIWIWVCV